MHIILWAFFTFPGIVNLPYPIDVFHKVEDCEVRKEAYKYEYSTLPPEVKVKLACLTVAGV